MIWKESGETEKKLQKKICYKSKKKLVIQMQLKQMNGELFYSLLKTSE